jgi:hypothetical protein
MPKGRKPKGEYAGKSLVFSTRITPKTREDLERAANQSGRSLSQEVEYRLRRSFVEDEHIADNFGDRQTYRVMRMMADAAHIAEEPFLKMKDDKRFEGAKWDWLNNPAAFLMARKAIISILDRFEPEGPPPPAEVEQAGEALGTALAGLLFLKILEADVTMPPDRRSRASVAKIDLQGLLDRPGTFGRNKRNAEGDGK